MSHLRENLDLVQIITASSVMLKLVGGGGGGGGREKSQCTAKATTSPDITLQTSAEYVQYRTDGRVSPLPSVGNTWVFVETQLVLLVYSMVLLTRTTHGYAFCGHLSVWPANLKK